MSGDPYDDVQQEIQTSLQTASTLRSSYLRIRSTAREESEELVWARNEVRRIQRDLRAHFDRRVLAESYLGCVGGGFGGP